MISPLEFIETIVGSSSVYVTTKMLLNHQNAGKIDHGNSDIIGEGPDCPKDQETGGLQASEGVESSNGNNTICFFSVNKKTNKSLKK